MKCPSCSNETNIDVVKKEYIYPELFLGMPAFWPFMSPTIARSVLAIILMFCIALISLTLFLFSQSFWFLGIPVGLVALFSVYVLVASAKSLGKYRLKEYHKCGACGLEWSHFRE